MFDVGFWEILFILVLALVIIGPERLPGAARKAGYFVGKARRYIEGVRSEVESELDVSEFKRLLHNQEVQINELQQQLKTGAEEVKSDITGNLPGADILDNNVLDNDILTDTPSHSVDDDQDQHDDEPNSENAENTPAVDDAPPLSTPKQEKS